MPDPSRWRAALICLGLALLTFGVYAPVRHFDFVNYDDQGYVINNFNINRGLSWAAFKWAFNAGYASNWHPLTWLSHGLDCQWFGVKPGPMHVTSLVWHVLNTVLVFLVLRSITGATWRSALVAALFGWHPLHVESVAWIAERKDVLSTFFFLLTIWVYARYARADSSGGAKGAAYGYYAGSLALFALGLMAKPMVVTLPCVLLLLDGWPLGRWTGKAATAVSLVVEKIPYFALAAVSAALTVHAQFREGAVRPLTEFGMGTRIINALVSYGRYLDKLAWPRKLSVIYPYDFDLPAREAVWAGLLIAAVCGAGVYGWKRRPYWLVGWLWYLGTLVPVIGIVQVGGQAMADRYSYIPSIGVFIVVAWALADVVEGRAAARVVAVGVMIGALGGCLYLTRLQALTWENGGTLAQHSIAVDPNNFFAHSSYASYLVNLRRLDEARKECEATLRLNPNFPPGHEYLGDVLYLQGHYAEAAEQLQWSLKLDPYKHDANLRLGESYLALERPEAAAEQFQTYLKYDGADPSAHCGLGKAYAAENRLEEACGEFAAAIKNVYAYPEAHFQLAMALSRLGRRAEAAEEYRAAVRYSPEHVGALNNLAWIQAASADASLRDGTNAVALAQRACDLTTNTEPLLIGTLAAALAEAGRFDEAVAAAQKAHDVAAAQTNEAVAARNLQLMELYRAHRAYHEE